MSRRLFFIALFVCAAAMVLPAQMRHQPGKMDYELYSWQDPFGGWTFSLFPAISNAGIAPGVIMHPSNVLEGQQKLKRAIAALPTHSQILWLDHSLGGWKDAKEWEIIKYPPPEVMADIRKFCAMKGYKLYVEQPKESKTK